ncbi:MAG: hypothetical protein GF320_10290 [Armatimonadia bacterium]|nr:hypothetical protein [Armatimonadia bacterium]
MTAELTPEDIKLKFRELAEAQPLCDLITVSEAGIAVPRPMGTVALEEDYTLWFVTYLSSRKVAHIGEEPRVTVYWEQRGADMETWTYGQLYGTAEILTDQAVRDRFWKDEWTRYFPGGSEDPEMAFIKITPTALEMTLGGEQAMRTVEF